MPTLIRQSDYSEISRQIATQFHTSGRCQFLFDRRDNDRVGWFDRWTECRLQIAVQADQIFMEIPARSIERTLRDGPFVERMRVLAFDRRLLGHRECDVVLALCSAVDVAHPA